MRLVITAFLTLALAACGSGAASQHDVVAIVDADEPGPRLTVGGRVVDEGTGEPIPNATIVVYQTDQSGDYAPADPSDESTARLRAELTTADDGGFSFLTVQPGEYPGQPPGNRHIHVHRVTAPGYESTGFVLLFDDNVRDEVRAWAEETGFGRVIRLSGDSTTGFEGFVEIGLRPVGAG